MPCRRNGGRQLKLRCFQACGLVDGLFERLQRIVLGRQHQRIMPIFCDLCSGNQIRFVLNLQHRFPAAPPGLNSLFVHLGRIGKRANVQDYLCFLRSRFGATYADILNRIRSLAQAGRVDEAKLQTVDIQAIFNSISGCAGDITDDSFFFAKQRVQQRGLACIDGTDNGNRNAVFDSIAQLERVNERSQFQPDTLCQFG